ncbi:MAG TPA: amidase family protein [Acidimicrobiales bacterium]
MDPYGALIDEAFVPVPGDPTGPLAGITFGAKDLFALRGRVTGAGQPTWAATHPPADADATAVERLLAAGATLVGRAHTAEMAYSLSGRDSPYGMPRNPAAPDHDPGGSSSGSAAAVAGGLADLGLGSDTLGSIRVPASYCGLYGWRPTHGRVPLDGVHPLAASLDTVGLLARDPRLLRTAAGALTGGAPTTTTGRVLVATEAFALLEPRLTDDLLAVAAAFRPTDTVDLTSDGCSLTDLTMVVRDVQGPEFAAAHQTWIAEAHPQFGPGVGERIAHALHVPPDAHARAMAVREDLRRHLTAVLRPGDVGLAPAAGRPPHRDADATEVAEARRVAASLSVVGSLGGLPTVTVPAVVFDGVPVGLSLIGAPGDDERLLYLSAGRPPVPSASRPDSPSAPPA